VKSMDTGIRLSFAFGIFAGMFTGNRTVRGRTIELTGKLLRVVRIR